MEHTDFLSYLVPGKSAVIQDIVAEDSTRHRLHAMGLCRGRVVQMVRRARFGGPLQIRVGSVNLILRKREAEHIKITHQ